MPPNITCAHQVYIFLPGLTLLTLWQLASMHSPQTEFFFASPGSIFAKASDELSHLPYWRDIGITSFEALSGLISGTIAGLLLALCLWRNPVLEKLTHPYLQLLGSIPLIVLAPVLILWFGIGIPAKIFISGYGVFLVCVSQTLEGFKSIDEDNLGFAREINGSRWRVFRLILMPSAARWILTGLRLNLGVALFGAFVGEFISSKYGLGHYVLEHSQTYDLPGVMLGVITFGILSLGFERILRFLIPDKYY